MAVMTLEQCKALIRLQNDPSLSIVGGVTLTSDIITPIDTIGLRVGNKLSGSAIASSAAIAEITNETTLRMTASAIMTDASAAITVYDRGNEYDDLIALYIPVVEDYIKTYCNTDFLDADGVEVWPDMVVATAAKMVWFEIGNANQTTTLGMKSESIGKYSYTTGETSYPEHIISKLKMYRRPRII